MNPSPEAESLDNQALQGDCPEALLGPLLDSLDEAYDEDGRCRAVQLPMMRVKACLDDEALNPPAATGEKPEKDLNGKVLNDKGSSEKALSEDLAEEMIGEYCDLADSQEDASATDAKAQGETVVSAADNLGHIPTPRQKSKRQQEMARRRQKTFLQKRREQKRLRVFYGRIRWIVRLVVACGLLYGLWYYFDDPALMYSQPQFTLSQNRLLTDKDIEPFAQHYVGTPLYQIDPEALEKAIQQKFLIVDRVYVRRHLFPARLEVSFVEKTPWAEVYESPEAPRPYALLTQAMDEKYHMISLKNYHFVSNQAGHLPKLVVPQHVRLKTHFMGKLDPILYQLSQLPGMHLDYLDGSQPDYLVAHFQESRIILGKLDDHSSERLKRLVSLAPKLQEWKKTIDSVDLRWSNQVTLHRKPTAASIAAEEKAAAEKAKTDAPEQGPPAAVTTIATETSVSSPTAVSTTANKPQQANRD